MASKWFCVKTLYRSYTEGLPVKPDRLYDPDATLIEERIVLLKARDKREALIKAEREARDYARKTTYTNPYEQKVLTRYTGDYDLWEVRGALEDRQELYSMGRVISRRVSDAKAAFLYIGKRTAPAARSKRRKFMNKDYLIE